MPSGAARTSSPDHRWLQFGSAAAFTAAAAALVAAFAGGITEPTGIAVVASFLAAIVAYGIAPLLLTIALGQGALSSGWAVAAALLAAVLWCFAGLFALPALAAAAPAFSDALIRSAPSASGLWILAASVEAVRAGLDRWSLVFVGAFLAVLIVGSVLVELSGFDIRKVLVPLGWAVWMVDVARVLRARVSPVVASAPSPVVDSACANCGAPRRTDGLVFCGACGLPYGTRRG